MSFVNSISLILEDKGRTVEEVVLQKRLATCESCPHVQKQILGSTCGICGCLIGLKAKYAAMDCPKHFWTSKAP